MKRRNMLALAALSVLTAQAGAVELIRNGAFQKMPPQDSWEVTGMLSIGDFSMFVPMPTNIAWLGGHSETYDDLYQEVDMGSLPGTATLSFDLGIYPGREPELDYLFIYLGGSLVDVFDLGSSTSAGFFGPARMSYDVSNRMGTGRQYLEFMVVTSDLTASSAFVDNVSLQANPVPEPATLAALGLGAASILRRRRV